MGSNAAGLAALPEADDDRREAEAHAARCEHCARALGRGAQLWSLLGQVPEPPPPEPEVLARVSRAVLDEMDREQARTLMVAVPLAVLAGFVALIALYPPTGGARLGLAALAVAAVLAAAVARAGWSLALAAVGASAGLSALAAGATATAPIAGCVLLEVGAGALPLAVMAALARRRPAIRLAPGRFAAAGAAGALAAQAALHLACPGHSLAHLMLFHTGGVIAAALLALPVAHLVAMARTPTRSA